ncbi:hypothetical protein [Arsenicibacter rosenii]|uniref:Uncharacterized protein n=1 Tax=Arsenicibacter rosenii TaxID=1750698 RepID=A0A1S2VNR6_9BACT|nr:hypothetical protein [Arsenicibacter rosenii]OIN59855.1 hypothetical protein BLX24_08340 [Arsenicibacter rosenii]
MKNPFFYILLLILVVLDGWLMSHPNLIGRFGVWFYEYDYLRTFPRAVGTVAAIVGVALVLSLLVSRLARPMALAGSAILLTLGILWLIQSIQQFTSGVYKLTGAGFKAGGMLLPALVVAVFAKGFYDIFRNRVKKV